MGSVAYLTHNGETHRLYEWADLLGIRRDAFLSRHARFKKGQIGEDLLFQAGSGADNHKDFLDHDGIRATTEEWAKRINVNAETFRNRVQKFKRGKMTEEQLFHRGAFQEIDKPRNIVVEHDGVRRTVSGWGRELGISGRSMQVRIERFKAGKMSEQRCFTYGHLPDERVRIKYRGKTYTKQGIARKLGVSTAAIDGRIRLAANGQLAKSRIFTKGTIAHSDRKFVKNKRYLLKNGERISIQKLADMAEVAFSTIKEKLKSGMSVDEIYAWAKDPYRRVKGACWFRGKKESIDEAVKDLGIDSATVHHRIYAGWSFRDAVTERPVPLNRSLELARSSRMRNRRISELRKMGVIV